MDVVAAFIQKIMKNSSKCEHCTLRCTNEFGEPYCFFAYACLIQDFYFFDEEDDWDD
jgi:hypothetical protein